MQLQSGESVVQVFSAEATQVKEYTLSPQAQKSRFSKM